MRLYLFVIFYFLSYCSAGKRKAQGKLNYELNWSEKFKPCDDFDNKIIDTSNLKVGRESPTSTSMGGSFVFTSPIIKGTLINIVIEKETPQGKILAYTMDVEDLCDHISEEGMPWSLFFDAMKLEKKECPLPAMKYEISELKLNLSFATSMMTHENVGEYAARLELQHQGDGLDVVEHTIACYWFGFSVDEVREQSD